MNFLILSALYVAVNSVTIIIIIIIVIIIIIIIN